VNRPTIETLAGTRTERLYTGRVAVNDRRRRRQRRRAVRENTHARLETGPSGTASRCVVPRCTSVGKLFIVTASAVSGRAHASCCCRLDADAGRGQRCRCASECAQVARRRSRTTSIDWHAARPATDERDWVMSASVTHRGDNDNDRRLVESSSHRLRQPITPVSQARHSTSRPA